MSLNIEKKHRLDMQIILTSLFGSLFLAYFGFPIILEFFFSTKEEVLMLSLLFNCFIWAVLCLWLFVSSSQKSAFYKLLALVLILVIVYILK